MALCPFTAAACLKTKCQWWRVPDNKNPADCSIALLPAGIQDINRRLEEIRIRLDRAFSEININGDRLLENYADEIEEAANDENREDK